MYLRSDTWSADYDVRLCSNCDRPAARETGAGFRGGPAIYSCSTCGQREAVSWRLIPSRVAEDVEVVEEPHIILGEH